MSQPQPAIMNQYADRAPLDSKSYCYRLEYGCTDSTPLRYREMLRGNQSTSPCFCHLRLYNRIDRVPPRRKLSVVGQDIKVIMANFESGACYFFLSITFRLRFKHQQDMGATIQLQLAAIIRIPSRYNPSRRSS